MSESVAIRCLVTMGTMRSESTMAVSSAVLFVAR